MVVCGNVWYCMVESVGVCGNVCYCVVVCVLVCVLACGSVW